MQTVESGEVVQACAVEHCWTLIGRRKGRIWFARRIRHCAGSPTTVEFDAASALQREEVRGDVIGFMHTHPHSAPIPSVRDIHTMQAWCTALGKPLLCVIAGIGGIAAHRFDDGDCHGVALTDTELFPLDVLIAVEPVVA